MGPKKKITMLLCNKLGLAVVALVITLKVK